MQVAAHAQVDLDQEGALPNIATNDDGVGSALPTEESAVLESPSGSEKSTRCAEHVRVWTPPRRQAVESYVAYLQDVLRLRDWTITVDWSKPTGKDALATMTQMTDSKYATLRLSPEFTTTSPQLHGQILLHELLHCHLFQMESLAMATVSALAGKDASVVFSRAYTSSNELATDALADAFEPLVTPFRLP